MAQRIRDQRKDVLELVDVKQVIQQPQSIANETNVITQVGDILNSRLVEVRNEKNKDFAEMKELIE